MMLKRDHLIRKPSAGILTLQAAAVWHSPLYVSHSSVMSLMEGYRGFGCGTFPVKLRESVGGTNAQYFSDRQRGEWALLQFTA